MGTSLSKLNFHAPDRSNSSAGSAPKIDNSAIATISLLYWEGYEGPGVVCRDSGHTPRENPGGPGKELDPQTGTDGFPPSCTIGGKKYCALRPIAAITCASGRHLASGPFLQEFPSSR